jgi:hypothetical protein
LEALAALLFLRPGFQKGFLNVRSPSVAADIPPAITTPDSIETRLGTLKFFDGFPDDATVQRSMDNLDFQRRVIESSIGAGLNCFLLQLNPAKRYRLSSFSKTAIDING